MRKAGIVHCVIVGALMSVFAAGAAAQAIEQDADNNYPKAQPLERGVDGTMRVTGVIGVSEFYLPPIEDVDLYSFYAREGDVLEIDIDGGIKSNTMFGAPRSVDTFLTILGPEAAYPVLRQASTCLAGVDLGSVSALDPCILNFRVPADGIYIVAVTGEGTIVLDGGHPYGTTNSNGEYMLIVSGASEMPVAPPPAPPAPPAPLVQVINIDIKPGSRVFAPVNPKSKGNIPVALLSNEGFEPLNVDRNSLTFGATGGENSLRKCAWEGQHVNTDDKLDLVCHFETEKTGFGPDNTEGVLKGTIGGKPFVGYGALKILPAPKKQK